MYKLLIFTLITFLFHSCDNLNSEKENPTNRNSIATNNTDDKFIGKWVAHGNNGETFLEISKEENLYIIKKYRIDRNYTTDGGTITGKLNNGSIEISSAMVGNIDLAELSNKLFLDGSVYTKTK